MPSTSAPPALRLRPGPSRTLALYLLAAHGCAFTGLLTLPPSLPRSALLLLVLASLVHAWGVHLRRRAPWSIREARWRGDGGWELHLADGRVLEPTLSASTFVSLPLVLLSFDCGRWRRRALPLFADALDAQTLRRLRQRLRTLPGAGETEG